MYRPAVRARDSRLGQRRIWSTPGATLVSVRQGRHALRAALFAACERPESVRGHPMATLRNQAALIAGAGRGLSPCLARLFSREVMRVAAAARDTCQLASLAAERGVQAFACHAVDPA